VGGDVCSLTLTLLLLAVGGVALAAATPARRSSDALILVATTMVYIRFDRDRERTRGIEGLWVGWEREEGTQYIIESLPRVWPRP